MVDSPVARVECDNPMCIADGFDVHFDLACYDLHGVLSTVVKRYGWLDEYPRHYCSTECKEECEEFYGGHPTG